MSAKRKQTSLTDEERRSRRRVRDQDKRAAHRQAKEDAGTLQPGGAVLSNRIRNTALLVSCKDEVLRELLDTQRSQSSTKVVGECVYVQRIRLPQVWVW